MSSLIQLSVLLLTVFVTACAAPGATKVDKRNHINTMHDEVLAELYRARPETRDELQHAPAYAVFSNINVNVLYVSAGNGFGLLRDNSLNTKTYMRMGEAGLGLGLGIKDFRAVFVFQNRAVMKQFIEQGWTFSAQADAAAKADEKGGSVGGEVLFNGIKVYQLTESGVLLQASVKGTKFWRDPELN